MQFLDVNRPQGSSKKGKNDDTYLPLSATWTRLPLVRIAVIPDGNCFIHALLKGINKEYQEDDDYDHRIKLAKELRKQLSVAAFEYREDGVTYWGGVDNGRLAINYAKIINNSEEKLDIVSKPDDVRKFLANEKKWMSNEFFNLIGDILDIDIYILSGTSNNTFIASHNCYTNIPKRISCIIVGDGSHFETVGLEVNGKFQTAFTPRHELIRDINDKLLCEEYNLKFNIKSQVKITPKIRKLDPNDELRVLLEDLQLI
jgi:hypothetical protein